jgi:hypothetical protein
MNSTKHRQSAARSNQSPYFISAPCVAGVNPDANDVSLCDLIGLKGFQSFICDYWIAVGTGSGAGKNIQPTRCNNAYSEGHIAWVDQMNSHRVRSFGAGNAPIIQPLWL